MYLRVTSQIPWEDFNSLLLLQDAAKAELHLNLTGRLHENLLPLLTKVNFVCRYGADCTASNWLLPGQNC